MSTRRLASLLAAALAAIAAPSVARAQIAVLSSTVEERTVVPGESYKGSIVVSNQTNQPQTARIYQTDYSFGADGTSHYDEAGTMPRSNARWVTPQTTRVVIPPNSQVNVSYSVIVPANDSLRGTYWSLVMVEGAPVDPAAPTGGKPAVGVGAIMRYAIQLATHIKASGTRTVQFSSPSAAKTAAGAATLDVDMLDTGERAFRPTLWVEVYDAQGVLRAKARQTRGLLYPGTSLRQHFDLGTLASGSYKAVIFVDTGEDSVFATQYTISY